MTDDTWEQRPAIPAAEVSQRVEALVQEQLLSLRKRTDRVFTVLLPLEWLAGLLMALLVSPRAWSGTSSHVHIHVWMALMLGGAIVAYPLYLTIARPGDVITRHAVALSQALISALFIHLTGGRIETHFSVFVTLAFIAFYRDWRVLITATVVVAVDHLVRGIYAPLSVYGVLKASSWRWVEHAAWVIFEDIGLVVAVCQSLSEMHQIAERQINLEISNANTERAERAEALLKKANRVLEEAVVGISQLGADGRFRSANAAYGQMLGYAADELLGVHWTATIHGASHGDVRQALDTR